MKRIRHRYGWLLLTIALATLISACGSSRKFTPADPHWNDADNRDAGDPGDATPGGPLLLLPALVATFLVPLKIPLSLQ